MGRRALRNFSVSFFTLLLALSCASPPIVESPSPDYSTLKREELAALAQNDQETCLAAVSIISSAPSMDPGLDGNSLMAIASEAAGTLVEHLSTQMENGQWKAAEQSLASLQSIRTLRDEVFSGAVKKIDTEALKKAALRVLVGVAREYSEKGLYAPSAAYINRALDLAAQASGSATGAAALDVDMLAEWYRRAVEAGDTVTAGKINAALDGEKAASLLKSFGTGLPATTIGEKAGGVVTVYVDKGLKIENGVGYPDRILGTAFQVDAKGYYLTNYHVVSSEVDPEYNGYSRMSIRPPSNPDARIPAKVIGWDEDLDLALLKSAEVSSHTFYPFQQGKTIKGQRVYAIGSPVGLENSVSSGIVSSTGRRILPRGEAIQIDVPVNPGNSGGPLLDDGGNLVGIVFAGLSGYQGLNFALPVSWVSMVFPSLFDGGKRETSWIGVGIAKNLDSSLDIDYVYPGTAGPGTTGFEAGDRLVSIDGQHCDDIQSAQMLMTAKPIGALCAVEIARNGKTLTLLRKTTAAPKMPLKKAYQRDLAERLFGGATGMLLEHISGPRGAGGTYKVLKTWPGLAADESGISAADVLKFIRYSIDDPKGSISFDVSVKSLSSGYLEHSMRMNLSLETDNFL